MNAARGWWGLACWNALSDKQRHELIHRGVIEIGYEPPGIDCQRGAMVAIEFQGDAAPGPRFYCLPCARTYLDGLQPQAEKEEA